MRIDKWLKISNLIKRRTIAQLACEEGKVLVNDKPAKPSHNVKVGEIITLNFAKKSSNYKVLVVDQPIKKLYGETQWFEEINQ